MRMLEAAQALGGTSLARLMTASECAPPREATSVSLSGSCTVLVIATLVSSGARATLASYGSTASAASTFRVSTTKQNSNFISAIKIGPF